MQYRSNSLKERAIQWRAHLKLHDIL